MSKPLSMVREVFYCQVLAAAVGLLIVMMLARPAFLSFALGEMVMVLANAFLAWRVLRQQNKMKPMGLLMSFLGGETGKYALMAVLTFALAKSIPLNWLFYIAGIGVPQLLGVIVYGIKMRVTRQNAE